uniref:RING-type domain-containing protein n=1 Tax=Amphimedon queenslandica TaxID=400682 RepID=A0A1X7TL13_AMPQE
MAEHTSPESITMTCEVCSEYYTDPLMLPCLHSFCKKCLIKAKEKQGSADTSLKCLTCDTSVNLPDGKIEGLTQNLWFEHKSREASIKKKILSKEAISCDKCDDSSDAAVVYCSDCGQFLCDYCKKGHKRNKKEASHKLIGLETKESIELPAINYEAIYYAQHPEKLTYYCNDCNKLSQLPGNYYLDEGDTAREALKKSVAFCGGVIPPVTEAIANGEKMLEQIATRKEEIRDVMILLVKTEEIASAKRNSVRKQLDGFRKLVKQVSHGRHLASSVSERTDPGEVLSVKKLITNQLEECIEEYKKLPLEIEENEKSVSLETYLKFEQLDPSLYSIDSGLAIPLASVKKERKFKVALPAGIDKAASYLKASFIKKDGSKEEGRVISLSTVSKGIKRLYQYHTKQRSFNVGNFGTRGVAVHTNGEVFASSKDEFVQVFSEDGTAVRKIGSKGKCKGQFDRPWGVLLVGDRLYVSDDNLHRVQYFSATTGQYIGQFGSKGNGNGQFYYPTGMSTDGNGNILVADYYNNRVQVFKEDGTFLQVIQCDGRATDVAVDNEGKIQVTIQNQNTSTHVQTGTCRCDVLCVLFKATISSLQYPRLCLLLFLHDSFLLKVETDPQETSEIDLKII